MKRVAMVTILRLLLLQESELALEGHDGRHRAIRGLQLIAIPRKKLEVTLTSRY